MPVFVRQFIDSFPSGGGGVDSSHQTFDDTDVVVSDIGKGDCAGHVQDL